MKYLSIPFEHIGTAQFVLFAVQRRTDRKKLFVWWINVSRKLVGISFMDNSKRMRILYFSNVPLEAKRWFELKLEFDGFLKSKPIVELFVNDTKVGRKVLTNVFRDKSTINVKDLEVRVAEMWGLTDKYSAPKVSRVFFFSRKEDRESSNWNSDEVFCL